MSVRKVAERRSCSGEIFLIMVLSTDRRSIQAERTNFLRWRLAVEQQQRAAVQRGLRPFSSSLSSSILAHLAVGPAMPDGRVARAGERREKAV